MLFGSRQKFFSDGNERTCPLPQLDGEPHPAPDGSPTVISQVEALIAASRFSRIFSPIAGPTSP